MNVTFEQVLVIVITLGFVVQSFMLYRSVPKEFVDKLLADAEPIAKATDTPLDDLVLSIAKQLRGMVNSEPVTAQHDPSQSRD